MLKCAQKTTCFVFPQTFYPNFLIFLHRYICHIYDIMQLCLRGGVALKKYHPKKTFPSLRTYRTRMVILTLRMIWKVHLWKKEEKKLFGVGEGGLLPHKHCRCISGKNVRLAILAHRVCERKNVACTANAGDRVNKSIWILEDVVSLQAQVLLSVE